MKVTIDRLHVGVVHGCVNCPHLRRQFVWSLLVCSSYIVRCPESRGCRISEVANTLCQWQFQLVLSCLSVVRRLSAFRGVRYGRFHCSSHFGLNCNASWEVMAATSNDQAIAQAWILQAVQKLGYSNIKPEQLVEFCRGTTCFLFCLQASQKSVLRMPTSSIWCY